MTTERLPGPGGVEPDCRDCGEDGADPRDDSIDVWPRAVPVAVAVMLMSASLVLTKTGRDALFFQRDGLFDLPLAYVGIALLSPVFAGTMLFLMKRVGPRRLRTVAPGVVAMALAGFYVVARPGGGLVMTAFFMVVPLAFGVLFSLAWLLAGDLMDRVPSGKLGRPYSLIGAAAIGGGILGGLAGRLLSDVILPARFIILGAVVLVLSGVVMHFTQKRFPLNMRDVKGGGAPGLDAGGELEAALRQPYVMLLLAIAVTGALTGILIEFQFYLGAATSGNSGQENAALFANLYMALNLGALLVQLVVVPELQKWIGVAGSLLVLPGALVGGGVFLAANSSLLARSGLRAAEGGLKSSIHRSNWEQAFLPIAQEVRGRVKMLVDGMATRIGEGLAAGAVFVWLSFFVEGELRGESTAWVTWLLVATAVVWLVLSARLRQRVKRAYGGAASPADMRTDLPLPDT